MPHWKPPGPACAVTCRCGYEFKHIGLLRNHERGCLGPTPTIDDLHRVGGVEITVTGCHEWRSRLFVDAREDQRYGIMPAIAAQQLGERAAHRAAFTLANGPIPDGVKVLHSCDNPPCINTEHLRAGTSAENSREMVARGRARNRRAS